MRDVDAGSRSRPFLRLASHVPGGKAPGVHGKRRGGRRVARRRIWRSTSAGLQSLSAAAAQYAATRPGSSVPVLTQYPVPRVPECPKTGGDADGTRF